MVKSLKSLHFKKLILMIISTSFVCLVSFTNAGAKVISSIDLIMQITNHRSNNFEQIKNLNSNIQKLILQKNKWISEQISQTTKIVQLNLEKFDSDLKDLFEQKKELIARQNLLNQMLHQVTIKPPVIDLKTYFSNFFLELSLTESLQNEPDQNLLNFYFYISISIKRILEPNENLVDFIVGYMEFSTLLNPVKPDEFLNLRHYTNGLKSVTVNPSEKESVGLDVEKRINGLIQTETQNLNPSPIETNTSKSNLLPPPITHGVLHKPDVSEKLQLNTTESNEGIHGSSKINLSNELQLFAPSKNTNNK